MNVLSTSNAMMVSGDIRNWLSLLFQSGCYAQMLMKNLLKRQKSIKELQEQICKNMLNEAVIIAKNGFPQRKQDLFMEQGTSWHDDKINANNEKLKSCTFVALQNNN